MEQDELAAQEQQLFNTAEESDDDEDDRMRQNLSELLGKMPRNGKVPPSKGLAPLDPTNDQLRVELDHMWRQWESDNLDWKQALEEANQQLAEEENAQQGEAREQVHYTNTNEKLEKQLDNFKSVLSLES